MQTTWYLKYRPQKVSELDELSVRESLGKILASGKMPHAFLFSGPRGSGKTSSARILAKAVNCLKLKNGEPCNECDQCVSITRGSNVDIAELDAASNRGIDEARAIKENITGKKVILLTNLKYVSWTFIDIALMKKAFAHNSLMMYNDKYELEEVDISKVKK